VIEFFSDFVSNAIAIGQVKEITGHASPTPPPSMAFVSRQADDRSAAVVVKRPDPPLSTTRTVSAAQMTYPINDRPLGLVPGASAHCWLTNKIKAPAVISRAIRIPTTNETTQCGRAIGFDPAPFCAAPMPNQKRSSSMGVSAVINAALWRPYCAYDYGELP
jgi:hypothetical protein